MVLDYTIFGCILFLAFKNHLWETMMFVSFPDWSLAVLTLAIRTCLKVMCVLPNQTVRAIMWPKTSTFLSLPGDRQDS